MKYIHNQSPSPSRLWGWTERYLPLEDRRVSSVDASMSIRSTADTAWAMAAAYVSSRRPMATKLRWSGYSMIWGGGASNVYPPP